jgi:hypothetical protein
MENREREMLGAFWERFLCGYMVWDLGTEDMVCVSTAGKDAVVLSQDVGKRKGFNDNDQCIGHCMEKPKYMRTC